MGKRKDLVGQRFGMLTALRPVGLNQHNKVLWECHCDCGNTLVCTQNMLARQNRSCGCARTKHGHALDAEQTRTYRIWCAIKQRCTNTKATAYKDYGGAGVRVHPRWETSFAAFLQDMGVAPDGMSIDRYPDRDGNYEPGNCRWATIGEQLRNTRRNVWVTYGRRTMVQSDWADELGIPRPTFREWVRKHGGERAVAMALTRKESR